MSGKYFVVSLIILLFSLQCTDSDTPEFQGKCRLTKIIYGLSGNETTFEYNDRDLLIGYNLPSGPTCRAFLEYDDQERLIRRYESCGNKVYFEIKYTYLTPTILEGKYTDHLSGGKSTALYYYNSATQIDSTKIISPNYETESHFTYSAGNLISSVETNFPCCRTYTLSGASYDNSINPFNLLKKATNSMGMESIAHLLPAGIFISSLNNPLAFEMLWSERASANDPRIISEEIRHHENFYEYYENSLYPKKLRSSLDGVVSSTELIFIYAGCN